MSKESKESTPAASSLKASTKGKSKAKVPHIASSNWLALQKKIKAADGPARKRRKLEHNEAESSFMKEEDSTPLVRGTHAGLDDSATRTKNGESVAALRRMVAGEQEYTTNQKLPGKYLSLDCEMVGIGIDGVESSLARVSIVNFHGHIILDEFVRQRERVVDYRTQWSGVRPVDMTRAKPFEEVQKQVAELLGERVLVGHAVYNDLKALLLSHPHPLTRDTQSLAGKHKLTPSKRPALRILVKQELGISIQEGEHSSVTDARATMAIYRMHRKEWDVGLPRVLLSKKHNVTLDVDENETVEMEAVERGKRTRGDEDDESDDDEDEDAKETVDEDEDDDEEAESNPKSKSHSQKLKSSIKPPPQTSSTPNSKPKLKPASKFPGGGRKGVSSGLSTVITTRKGEGVSVSHRSGAGESVKATSSSWWKELPGSGSAGGGRGGRGSKGSFSVRVRR